MLNKAAVFPAINCSDNQCTAAGSVFMCCARDEESPEKSAVDRKPHSVLGFTKPQLIIGQAETWFGL